MLSSSNLTLLLTIIAIAQAIIIGVALMKSSLERKNSTKLAETNVDLEKRIRDRTESLRSINNRLYKEITRHQETSQDLAKAKRYLSLIIDRMPSIIIAYDADLMITHWNTLAEKSFASENKNYIGKPLNEALGLLPSLQEELAEAATQGVSMSHKEVKVLINEDNRVIDLMLYPLLVKGNFVGGVIRIDDVTRRTRLESMVIQSEKMSSLGQLAAGLAHEINNPLGAIIQSLQTIKRRVDPDLNKNKQVAQSLGTDIETVSAYFEERQIAQYIDNTHEAGTRAAEIIKSMLGFSRIDGKLHPTSINQVINDSIRIIHLSRSDEGDSLTEGVTIKCGIEETDDIVISMSASQIQQVLINLITNAIQAAREHDVSAIYVTVDTKINGREVEFIVSDNGPGINQSNISQLFEPFFTTKEAGKGTGLGLSISYFIVCTQHGGRFEATNRAEGGASFIFTLPRT